MHDIAQTLECCVFGIFHVDLVCVDVVRTGVCMAGVDWQSYRGGLLSVMLWLKSHDTLMFTKRHLQVI